MLSSPKVLQYIFRLRKRKTSPAVGILRQAGIPEIEKEGGKQQKEEAHMRLYVGHVAPSAIEKANSTLLEFNSQHH